MIVEERALIQTPRKRQSIWNQEGDKEYGTKKETKEMERTWAVILQAFFTLFHFTHYLALFVLHFTVLMQQIKKLVARAPTAERKRQRKLSGHRLLF